MRVSRPFRMAAAATLVVSVAVGAGMMAAGASSPASAVYYACLKSGALSKVGTTPPTCTAPATQISWNQTGPAGAAGNTILSGTTTPSPNIGTVGNFYIDTTTESLYGPAGHTCLPLPCHTIWGTATSLVGPQGPPGQGYAYDTQMSSPLLDPDGASERVLTQTLPSGGDFTITAEATGDQFGSNASAFFNCALVAANPGGSTVTIDTVGSFAPGEDATANLYLQGVVSLAPGGLIGINCDDTAGNPSDEYTQARITSTQVSGFSIVAPG